MELSESTKNIFKALSEFRKNIIQPRKEADNPQFRSKYVPLELVTDAIDKVAPKYGLAYFQNLSTQDENTIGVQTIITHESGEYIVFDWLHLDARPIIKGGSKGQVTSQSQGSAVTYGRRYSLSSAFGIASEVDDDGNEASGNNSYQNDRVNQGKTISEPNKGEAMAKAKELKKSIAELKKTTQKQVDEWLFDYMQVKHVTEITDWNKAVLFLIRLESKAKEQIEEKANES